MSVFAATPADAALLSEASVYPEYPSEAPGKQALRVWIETFGERATNGGFGCFIRGEMPYDLAKLQERPLLPVPADGAAKASVEVIRLGKATASTTRRKCRQSEMRMETGGLHAQFDAQAATSSGATCSLARPTTRGRQKNRWAMPPKRGTLDTP